MPIRLKKLIGTILLVALVIVYALVATTVAAARLAEVRPAGPPRLLLLHRHFVGIAGDGHHKVADAAAQAERLTAIKR